MDMPHAFHAEQWLPYPIELVFAFSAFFANPETSPALCPRGREPASKRQPSPRLRRDPELLPVIFAR
jgi:hypothetical protein